MTDSDNVVLIVKNKSFSTKDFIETVAEAKRKLGFVVYVYETYVTRKSLMNGVEFQERYDTPYYCSPSSESYWSM